MKTKTVPIKIARVLLAAAKQALAGFDSEVESEYGGTSLLLQRLTEMDSVRRAIAKYEKRLKR
jgi:hypothetical protein